jgi:hypothetical protein
MKYWEIIADNLKKRGWSLGYVSAIDSNGRTIFVVDAHRGDGKRFVVRANKKLDRIIGLEFLRSQNPFDTVELRVLVLGGMPSGSGQRIVDTNPHRRLRKKTFLVVRKDDLDFFTNYYPVGQTETKRMFEIRRMNRYESLPNSDLRNAKDSVLATSPLHTTSPGPWLVISKINSGGPISERRCSSSSLNMDLIPKATLSRGFRTTSR